MATDKTEIYPRGQISMGAGDLVDVTNVSFTYTHNAKSKTTLKRPFAGVVLGAEEFTGKFDSIVPAAGLERDYFARVQSGEVVSARIKLPGLTLGVDVVLVSIDGEMPEDDACKLTTNFVGKRTD